MFLALCEMEDELRKLTFAEWAAMIARWDGESDEDEDEEDC